MPAWSRPGLSSCAASSRPRSSARSTGRLLASTDGDRDGTRDGGGYRIRRGHGRIPGGTERHGEDMLAIVAPYAGGECIVGRHWRRVRAREVDLADIARRGVAIEIFGGHRQVERRSMRDGS